MKRFKFYCFEGKTLFEKSQRSQDLLFIVENLFILCYTIAVIKMCGKSLGAYITHTCVVVLWAATGGLRRPRRSAGAGTEKEALP